MSTFIVVRHWRRPDQPQPVYKAALTLWEAWFYPPIGDQTRNSFRTRDRVQDRTYVLQTAPSFAWISVVLPAVTTAQIWPAVLQGTDPSFVTRARAGLDVRTVVQPSTAWMGPVVDATVATWAPVFQSQRNTFLPPSRPRLDVRTTPWRPSESAWIGVNLVAATVAQRWPALLLALAPWYRAPGRALLDVRRYDWSPEWGWLQPPAVVIVPIPPTTLGHRDGGAMDGPVGRRRGNGLQAAVGRRGRS